jgi:Domain of unknown function (DUF3291)
MYLAQVNIATMLAPIDSEIMSGFVAQLDEINALAEASEGFIWRLKGEENNATALRVFENDHIIINMSVWESVESLKNYVYKSAHKMVMRDREKWFSKHESAYMALWWIPEGHIPTPHEAKERLAYLDTHGESDYAFTFKMLK